jgi:hypothetical protein
MTWHRVERPQEIIYIYIYIYIQRERERERDIDRREGGCRTTFRTGTEHAAKDTLNFTIITVSDVMCYLQTLSITEII